MKPLPAELHCDDLDLGGQTDWRVPSISELRSLVRVCPGTVTEGSCNVSDLCLSLVQCFDVYDCQKTCNAWGGPGVNGCYWPEDLEGECDIYWSSSIPTDFPAQPPVYWTVRFADGDIVFNDVTTEKHVRCVR